MTESTFSSALAALRRTWLLSLIAVFLCAAAMPAPAQEALRGVALVIGNGDYEHLAPLTNPPDDADAIEELLSDLGFDSVRRTDRDADDLTRDLERFVEDAEEADVAVLYYAGHGIEAGGENWLVPVDADISALDSAATKLVPVSDVMRRLRETVAVTIVLLDACRDNPFPDGATLKVAANADPLPVSTGGLAVADTRGASALAKADATPSDNLGIVIGFAAAPGQVALDGSAGENSPYAAALTRHISAMAGEEFGTVMRMVAEEVYLKTAGAQRPWVNESLRRLLYFGEAPQPVEGAEGDILTERRQLLLSIAALPTPQRESAEGLSRSGNVPMSVVFAMMRAAGIDPNDDPATVEARLKAEIDRFAENRNARAALLNPDPEIQRLTELADQAELEGALNAANELREQAKARVASLRETRQEQVAALRQRIIEDGEVYARSAETKLLLFDYLAAARDYGEAFDIIAEWDIDRAFDYRRYQFEAYKNAALERGDLAALAEGEEVARRELETPTVSWTPTRSARFAKQLGQMLLSRARLTNDPEALRQGRDFLQQALDNAGDDSGREKGAIWNDLAVTALTAAQDSDDAADYEFAIDALNRALAFFDPGGTLDEAIVGLDEAARSSARGSDAVQAALKEVEKALDPSAPKQQIEDWSMAKHNLGVALRGLARLRKEPALRDDALTAYDLALKARKATGNLRDAASTQMNIGNIHFDLASEGIEGASTQAIEAYEKAVELYDSKAYPVPFADAVLKLSNAVLDGNTDTGVVERALEVLREASAVVDPGAAGADLAEIFNNTGRAHYALALASDDADHHREAVAAYRKAVGIWADVPRSQAIAQRNMGYALFELGRIEDDAEAFREAAAAHGSALRFWSEASEPAEIARTAFSRGQALHERANRTDLLDDYRAALEDYHAALAIWTDAEADWVYARRNSGHMLFAIGLHTGESADFEQAAGAYRDAAAAFEAAGQVTDRTEAEFERGRAWHEIAYRTGDAAAWRKALDAYEAAIGAGKAEPAMHETVGYAHANRAILYQSPAAGSAASPRDAVREYRAAIEYAERDDNAALAAERRAGLADSLLALARETGTPADFDAAIAAYDASLGGDLRAGAPLDWARRANSLAYALVVAGKETASGPEPYARAVGLLRDATAIQRDAGSAELGYSEDTLCEALIELGRAEASRARVGEGLDACARAMTAIEQHGLADVAQITEANIARGRKVLAELD
ncbi:caspase family protein [Mesorhizobium sp. Z1-4]|uniref:caspase family protein n=1 Tax=Mesorhizobium sp. Z1-4 TaxID=2448478 RepID=UPI000FD920B1|nr:caspase family protein [Mesorhizobium sp. Z1-4]